MNGQEKKGRAKKTISASAQKKRNERKYLFPQIPLTRSLFCLTLCFKTQFILSFNPIQPGQTRGSAWLTQLFFYLGLFFYLRNSLATQLLPGFF
jgi:hypothetical protein